MADQCDITIIGAGAAGLAAGIFAAQANPKARIVLLDGAKKIGAKILVSGGGRCNVTHQRVTTVDFNGKSTFVKHVLAAFDEKQTREWFDQLGVKLKQEPTGKLFPVSNSAHTVLNALVDRCKVLNIQLMQQCRVNAIRRDENGGEDSDDAIDRGADHCRGRFLIQHTHGEIRAGCVIMATGGKSLPKTGSDGEGWAIVKRLGHTVTPTYPALAPLVLNDGFFHADLSGQSLMVELSTFVKNKRIDQRIGSMLFTHFGLSGPVVMDASRHWIKAVAESGIDDVELRCNFIVNQAVPAGGQHNQQNDQSHNHLKNRSQNQKQKAKLTCADFAAVEQVFLDQTNRQPRQPVRLVVHQWLAKKISEAILNYIDIQGDTPLSQLKRDDRRRLVHALTAMRLPVLRDRGWNYAEVTAGGVPLSEVHHRDLQSRVMPGLYLIGEMLDCDGRIGGFNFQWAWATGFLAGSEAGRSLNHIV